MFRIVRIDADKIKRKIHKKLLIDFGAMRYEPYSAKMLS